MLGLKAVAGNKYDREETTEAAKEAERRTARVCTMQIPTKEKIRLIKASPIKVLTACMQWGKPKQKAIDSLRNQIVLAIWGKNRRTRCPEILWGLLYDGAEIEPSHAITWQNLQTARRILTTNASMKEVAIRVIKEWQKTPKQIDERRKKEEEDKGHRKRRQITKKTRPEDAPPAYRRRLTNNTRPENAPAEYRRRIKNKREIRAENRKLKEARYDEEGTQPGPIKLLM